MALETGNRIEDLVTTNPATGDNVSEGDDHLRLIKACVQGSFPSLGSTAVTATASQLNSVSSKLVSFNGRTATAAVPASGDYELGDGNSIGLGDVNISSVADGDMLVYDDATSKWINRAAWAGFARYDGLSGSQGNEPYFTTETFNNISSDLGTVKNDGTSSVGWRYTAAVNQIVSISITRGVDNAGGSIDVRTAISIDRAGTSTPASGDAETVAYDRFDQDGSASIGQSSSTAHVYLATNDYISVYSQIDVGSGRWINLSMNAIRAGA